MKIRLRRAVVLGAGLAVAAAPSFAEAPAGPADGWGYVEVDDARGKWGDSDEPDWLRYFDLDADGDLDIVGHAWDQWRFLHLWRNEGP